MARMIDADDLKAEIANYFLSCVDRGEIVIDIPEMQSELYKLINAQPTAYDVEKVVGELAERRTQLIEDFVIADVSDASKHNALNRINELDGCIEFVRKGGVE